MFSRCKEWILSFFQVKEEERYDLYKPSERNVYTYFSGYTKDTMVKADPVVLWKKVMDKGAEIDADWKAAATPQSKFAKGARENLIKNIRGIFNLKPFEEGGLSEWDATDLLIHFMTYCGMIKKNSNPLPTSSPNTEDSTSSGEANPPTQPSLDSGSTETDKPTEKPVPSPSASA